MKPYFRPNSLISISYPRRNCLKTTPFTAASTYTPHIWQCLSPNSPWWWTLRQLQARGQANKTMYVHFTGTKKLGYWRQLNVGQREWNTRLSPWKMLSLAHLSPACGQTSLHKMPLVLLQPQSVWLPCNRYFHHTEQHGCSDQLGCGSISHSATNWIEMHHDHQPGASACHSHLVPASLWHCFYPPQHIYNNLKLRQAPFLLEED